jgi:hypothetical protein
MAQEVLAEVETWPECLAKQLRAAGLTRGELVEQTITLLRQGAVTEEQVGCVAVNVGEEMRLSGSLSPGLIFHIPKF